MFFWDCDYWLLLHFICCMKFIFEVIYDILIQSFSSHYVVQAATKVKESDYCLKRKKKKKNQTILSQKLQQCRVNIHGAEGKNANCFKQTIIYFDFFAVMSIVC